MDGKLVMIVVILLILFLLLISSFCIIMTVKYYNMGIPESKGIHRHHKDKRRVRGDNIEITTTGGIPILSFNSDGLALYNPETGSLTAHTLSEIDGPA